MAVLISFHAIRFLSCLVLASATVSVQPVIKMSGVLATEPTEFTARKACVAHFQEPIGSAGFIKVHANWGRADLKQDVPSV